MGNSSSGGSFKERMAARQKELRKRGGGKSNVIFLKDGESIRFRVMNPGKDKDFTIDVESFYLGGDVKNVYSPNTFGLPCAFHEKYQELKDSKVKGDKALAKRFIPKKKPMVAVIPYTDLSGKDIDEEGVGKLLQLTSGTAAEMVDYFLDENDWGDFFDKENGYDFKLSRTGSGQFDTEYTLKACKPTSLPKKYRDMEVDLEEVVKAILPSYEETVQHCEEYLGTLTDVDEDEDKPRKKKSRKDDDDDDEDERPRRKRSRDLE